MNLFGICRYYSLAWILDTKKSMEYDVLLYCGGNSLTSQKKHFYSLLFGLQKRDVHLFCTAPLF